jgi:hypothetical protein
MTDHESSAAYKAEVLGPTDRCESVLVVSTSGYVRTVTRYVRCRRHGAHAGLHFASWGGSQAWRQAEWSNRDANAVNVRDVPRGRRIW